MRTLRYRSLGKDVFLLKELLQKLGYDLVVSTYFDLKTLEAVTDFQMKNSLVIDGIVGPKTWLTMLKMQHELFAQNDKFLSETDLTDFAEKYGLDLAVVKAVNEVESSGNGFLIDGRPKILFEGHVFWRELQNRGINPLDFVNKYTQNILYKSWTKKYYVGGAKEYHRLDKATGMSEDPKVREAALSSTSWGSFQIMGFNAVSIGYPNVEYFVSDMYEHEREHLRAFGLFLEKNNLINYIKRRNWSEFAKRYNGSAFVINKYDIRLQVAYEKFSK